MPIILQLSVPDHAIWLAYADSELWTIRWRQLAAIAQDTADRSGNRAEIYDRDGYMLECFSSFPRS